MKLSEIGSEQSPVEVLQQNASYLNVETELESFRCTPLFIYFPDDFFIHLLKKLTK